MGWRAQPTTAVCPGRAACYRRSGLGCSTLDLVAFCRKSMVTRRLCLTTSACLSLRAWAPRERDSRSQWLRSMAGALISAPAPWVARRCALRAVACYCCLAPSLAAPVAHAEGPALPHAAPRTPMQFCLDHSREYVKNRKQFGHAIADFQATQVCRAVSFVGGWVQVRQCSSAAAQQVGAAVQCISSTQ